MSQHRPIRFMTTPAFGEVKEHVRAEMLAVALTRRLNTPVTIEPASSYEELVAALGSGEIDAAWGTAELCDRFESSARAVLRAVRSGSAAYHAAFICRAEDPLTLDGLEGTRAAWVTRWSTAGYLLPRAHLEAHGIAPDRTFESQAELGTYRRALLAVLEGEADLASIYCTHPDDRAVRAALAEHVGRREGELLPFAFTRSTAADGILITQRLDEAMAERVIEALVDLGSGGSGLLPQLGLFDTEGFALDGHVVPAPARTASGEATREPLVMIEVTRDLLCQRAWTQSGRINGRPCAAVVGEALPKVLGREAAAPVTALVSEAFRNGFGGRIDFHAGTDDDARCYEAEVTPSHAGEHASAALIIRDVTDARALEEGLFHLASYPLLTPDPVLEIDRDGTLVYANRAAHLQFPGLVAQGADHPIISALLAVNRSPPQHANRAALREVEHDGRAWKITVLSPPDTDFIRASVLEVADSSKQRRRGEALLSAAFTGKGTRRS